MVRDRFILGQRDCRLRRHLDSVPPGHANPRYSGPMSHSDKNRKSPPGTDVGHRCPAVASVSRESSFFTDGFPGMITSPVFEQEIPVVVVQDVVCEGSTILEEWDQFVLDRTMNCGDSRELLTNTYDFPGIAGGLDVTPEFVIAIAQCASPEELPTGGGVSLPDQQCM